MALTVRVAMPTWGQPGAPLLPKSLRKAWEGEAMPAWLVEEVGLPEGTSLDQLGAGIWKADLDESARLERYLVSLVDARRSEIRDLPVLTHPWPPELDPEDIPWSTRVRNALDRADLLQPTKLSALSFGEALAVRAMGAKSVLELASTLEGSIIWVSRHPEHDLIPEIMKEAWVEMVSIEDPRFASLLPPGKGTVSQRLESAGLAEGSISTDPDVILLVEALPQLAEEVHRVAEEPLDVALRNFIQAVSGLEGVRLEALLARLGLDGEPKRTLQETGDMIGVSRERMRQIEVKARKGLPSHPIFMPALDEAMDIMAEAAPIAADEAARLLEERGLTTVPFHPESLIAAADFCGRPATFQIERVAAGGQRVVTDSRLANARRIISAASRQASSIGVCNVAEVAAALRADSLAVPADEIRDVLEHHSDAEFLVDNWFWMPERSPDRNRLRNTTRAMLSVVSPLPLSTIREGARRRYRFHGLTIVPPRNVLLEFFRGHPEFKVEDEDRVGSAVPLDFRTELGATEQALVEVLRSAPTGVLDRAGFEQGALDRGVNPNTFNVYASYSPIVEHLGTDLWALRGVQVDPAAVEALRRANAQRPRERRIQDFGWTPEGRLWLAVRLGRPSSVVITIPSAISNYLADRNFRARALDGSDVGEVVIAENASSWGYTPFLGRMGADEGDVLRIEFDLVTETAVLQLGGDEILEIEA